MKFGLIADVQHADLPVGTNYDKSRVRYYRDAFVKLERAVEWWKEEKVGFVLSLGDVIDGYNKEHGVEKEMAGKVLGKFAEVGVRCHQLVGNHELLNFNVETLGELGWGAEGKMYYGFAPCEGWRILVLNSYEISVIRHDDHNYHNPPDNELLRELLVRNKNLSGGPKTWNTGISWYSDLEGDDMRYLPYNGKFGEEQLKWVETQLAAASSERVLICSHTPIHPGASNASDIAIDSDKLLAILHHNPKQIAAVFCGHNHDGGRCTDEAGIPHITFEAPLEAGPEVADCAAICTIEKDMLKIEGKGSIPSATIDLRPLVL